MIKKILVATDASAYSQNALKTAIEYAKAFQAEIKLLYVFVQPRSYGTFTGLRDISYPQHEINIIGSRIMEITRGNIDPSGVKIVDTIVVGNPANAILEEIDKGIDLVVMGSRGHSSISGILTGSVTQKVVGLAQCPVLIVKDKN